MLAKVINTTPKISKPLARNPINANKNKLLKIVLKLSTHDVQNQSPVYDMWITAFSVMNCRHFSKHHRQHFRHFIMALTPAFWFSFSLCCFVIYSTMILIVVTTASTNDPTISAPSWNNVAVNEGQM